MKDAKEIDPPENIVMESDTRVGELETALAEERRRSDALNRNAAAIAAGRDLDEVIQAVVAGGVELTGAELGAFFYSNNNTDGGAYTLHTVAGAPRAALTALPMLRTRAGLVSPFAGAGVVRSDDIAQDPRFDLNAPRSGTPEQTLPVHSCLAAPVISRTGEVLGGLFFAHARARMFDERLEFLLEGLSSHAAVAIDNARLKTAATAEVAERRRAEAALADSDARFRLIADTIPILCWMATAEGEIDWYNRRWYEYVGATPEAMRNNGWRAFHHPDVLPEVETRWSASLKTGEPFEMTFPLRGADGEYRPFLTRVEPNRDAEGRIVRWFGVNVDVTGETAAHERLQFALDAARLGSWELDVETGAYTASDLCKANYGRTPDQPLTFEDLKNTVHPQDRARMRAAIDEAIRSGGDYDIEYRVVHPNGDVRWIHVRGQAASPRGGRLRMAGVSLDITERKQAEERQRLLLHELNHRVKNTLATVQSIAHQSLRNARSPSAFRDAFEARLFALSQTHNLLTDQKWEGASLNDILLSELTPHAGGRGRFTLESDREVRLTPKAAVALGMAIHELATNAVKYGAFSTPEGRVTVRSTIRPSDTGPRLALEWREMNGPPVKAPSRRGFGGRLLERGLAGELSGQVRLDYHPEGLSCRMDLPLDALEPSE